MTVIGTAEVVVHAATHGFAKEVEMGTAPAFRAVEAEASAAGVRSGEAMAAGVNKSSSKTSAAVSGAAAVGKKAMLGLGLATAGVLVEGVHLAEGMQKVDASIASSSKISINAATAIGDAFLGTAGKSTFSGQEMASAYAGVAGQLSAVHGKALDAKQALEVMEAATSLAEAKGIDLASATKTVSSTMQAFGLDTEHAAHVSDVLFSASNATGTSVEQLANQLTKMHGKMGDTAGTLTEMSGLLVDMTNHGITGRSAMIGLTSGLSNLSKTSNAVATATDTQNQAFRQMSPALQKLVKGYQDGSISSKELHAATATLAPAQAALVTTFNTAAKATEKAESSYRNLGVTAFDSKGKFVGMGSIIEQLSPKFAKMTQQQQISTATTIFGAGAARQMTAIINAGSGAYEKATRAVAKHGQAEDAAKKQAQTLHGQVETLKATLTDMATGIGEHVIPVVTSMARGLVSATQFVLKHKTATTILTTALVGLGAGFLAVKVAAGFTALIEGLSTAFWALDAAMTANPIGVVVVALAALAAGLVYAYTHSETFRNVVNAAFHAVSKVVETVVSFIGDHWKTLVQVLLGPIGVVLVHWRGFKDSIVSIFHSVTGFISDAWHSVTSTASAIPGKILGFFKSLPGEMAQLGKDIVQGIVNGILAAPGAVVDALGGVVKNAVSGVKHFLHIGSPSKLMHQYGQWTTQGFQEGVKDAAETSVTTPMGTIKYVSKSIGAAATGSSPTAWAQSMIGHFAENTGSNTGTELDKLEKEFGMRAQQWCAMFATTAATMGGASNAVKTASVAVIRAHAQSGTAGFEKGVLGGKQVRQGDLFMHGNEHTGVVQSVNRAAGTFTSIEGNTSAGKVAVRTHPLSGYADFARPKYSAASASSVAGASAGASAGHSTSTKSLAQQKTALDKEIIQEKAALDRRIRSEEDAVRHGTQAQKDGVARQVVQQKAALATQIIDQKAALAGTSKAQKAEAAKQSKDQKAGTKDLNDMLSAIHSGSLDTLNKQLDSTHEKSFRSLIKALSHDHSAALKDLGKQLTKVHKDALTAQAKAQAEEDAKQAAEAAAAADQAQGTMIGQLSKITSDGQAAQAQAIQDATRVTLDQQAEAGKTGAALIAAQAQTALDVLSQQQNAAIAAAQLTVDRDVNASQTVQAQAAADLAAISGNAAIAEAQAQANLDLANAAASAADAAAAAAAQAASDAASAASDATSTPVGDPGLPATSTAPIFHITINGAGATAVDIASEISWALKTGAIPLAAAAPAA